MGDPVKERKRNLPVTVVDKTLEIFVILKPKKIMAGLPCA